MMKRPITLILLLLTVTSTSIVVEASERLHYRLSYSGLITGFFWKKLADVTLKLQPEAITFHKEPACHLSMEIDTSAYLFAEMIHPVRYHWESILTPNLQRTLLSRTIDTGASDLHEAAWYDWENRTISLFRKRKQIDLKPNTFDEGDEANRVWEKDIYKPAPEFIDTHPPIQDGLGYLIQTKYFQKALSTAAIDPLAMIQRARIHNFDQSERLPILVSLDEELRDYQAHLEGRPTLQVGEQLHPSTLKVAINRADDQGKKGAMHLWLSNDPKRLPLRIDIDAPLGMIHLELLRIEDNLGSTKCAPQRMVQGKTTPIKVTE